MAKDNPRTDPDRIPNSRFTWESCSVLLDINDGDRLVFARLSGGAKLKIGNKNYSLQPLIGAPFGSLFQVVNGGEGSYLSRILPNEDNNDQNKQGEWLKDESRDNREIFDNNEAQNLTVEEIEAMRRQGATGDEIVEALIANSKTFEKKTQFSQEKYRLRKQKKYAPKLLIRRPFARSICEAYFKKHPSRIGFLRVDMLSLLLSMANVGAHSDVLVVDMVGGIVTGAIAERLGGSGYVCNTYWGSSPYPVDIVRMFNFSDEVAKRIVRCSVTDLRSLETATPYNNNQEEEASNTETKTNEIPSSDTMGEASLSCEDRVDNVSDTSSLANNISKAPKPGAKASKEAIHMWRENGFSSLIIAAPELDAWSLAKDLFPLLSYSAPFAIYHQYLQPLATCMHKLQVEKMAINLQISEPWLREYQVLPSRTHPHMQMSAFGGYVLSGTKISGGC